MFAGSSIVCRMGHAGAGRRNMDIHAGRRVGEIRGHGSQATRAVDLGGVGLVGCLLLFHTSPVRPCSGP